MVTRRTLIKRLAGLPLVGGFFGAGVFAYSPTSAYPVRRDYFKELGVRTFINAAGTYTFMTGCFGPCMNPAVAFFTAFDSFK